MKSKESERSSASFDPEMLQAAIAVAGWHIESGTRAFGAFAQAMVDDLGDEIRPYLASVYEAIRCYPGLNVAHEMTPSAEVHALRVAGFPGLDARSGSGTAAGALGTGMHSGSTYDVSWLIAEGRRHWKEYLPKLYRKLKRAGTLEQSLHQAAEATKAMMVQMESAGVKPAESWPEVRSEFLILDPRHYGQGD